MLDEKRGRKRVIREQYDIKTNQRSKTDLQKRAVEALERMTEA
jgi:hypothetical protein